MNEEHDEKIVRLAEWLTLLGPAYAFTGAGVSTDSGIRDFRGSDGLWKDHDPMEVASRTSLEEDPEAFFGFWVDRFSQLGDASPNITHEVLANLEEFDLLDGVITQNIDGLHREGGSRRVLQLHGNFRVSRCEGCGKETPTSEALEEFETEGVPRCNECGGLIRPDVVLFGEQLPDAFTEAESELERSKLLLVLGTSLGVYPAASLVPYFKKNHGKIVIVNKQSTPYDGLADLVINGELTSVMKDLQVELGLA